MKVGLSNRLEKVERDLCLIDCLTITEATPSVESEIQMLDKRSKAEQRSPSGLECLVS